jgi:pimeloyl-ACP methyl ester carboxylesterase
MKKSITSVLFIITALFTLSAKPIKMKNENKSASKTFVLVHGAWLAPYSWDAVKKELTQKGQHVIVVELPGHGSDTTPPQNLSIDVYKDKVIAAINGVKGKVILVGHSLAGVVISAVAEQIPDKIETLVYVGAYIPATGQSLLDLANTDPQSLLGPSLIPSADKLTLDVKHENIINIFCADSSPETQQLLLSKYKPEPAIPFTNKVTLTDANFGKVSKVYIHTLQDHAIGMDLQNRMVATAKITKIYSLNSSHTPFLSMPAKLTALLLEIAK